MQSSPAVNNADPALSESTVATPEVTADLRHADLHSTLDVDEVPDAPRTNEPPRLPVIERNRYGVLGEVGQGGVGKVFSAHDARLDRVIALKELRYGSRTAELRFLREALMTARLQHPAIVPIYEAGRWPSGEPFYAMKLVSGQTLLEAIAARTKLEDRLTLVPHVLTVADAIAYAHAKRIIHRDVKPTNIVIGEFGETLVIDWGLAKDLANKDADDDAALPKEVGAADKEPFTDLTLAGAIVGTPGYMSPEQAHGIVVDERADVYALGAVLYHVLAGTPPYDGTDATEIVKSVLVGPPKPIEQRAKGAPLDLLAIVNKAMARDLEIRYRTASELAEDLRRFQTGQIVAAHRYSTPERFWRFVKRYQAAVIVFAIAFVFSTTGAIFSIQRIVDAQRRAERGQSEAIISEQRAIARADELTLAQARASLEQDPTKSIALLKSLSPQWSRWGAVRTLAADAASRGIARILRGHSAPVQDFVFSPDGQMGVSVGDDRRVLLHDLRNGQTRSLMTHTDAVWRAAFSPDGKFLATSGRDKQIHVWDFATNQERIFEGHTAPVTFVVFSPDGAYLASRGFQEMVRLWDVATGHSRVLSRTKESRKNERGCVAFSPDGKSIAFADEGGVVLEDIASGQRRFFGEIAPGGVEIAFSPDGSRIVTGAEDGNVRLWDVMAGKSDFLYAHAGVRAPVVGFAGSGAYVVSGGTTGTVHRWDIAMASLEVLGTHGGYIERMAVSRDGNDVVTAGADGTVRVWHVATGESQVFRGFTGRATAAAISPDGLTLAGASTDTTVRLWKNLPSPAVASVGPIHWVAFAADGSSAATLGEDGIVRKTRFDASDKVSSVSATKWNGPINHATPPPALMSTEPPFVYSSNGRRIAAAYHDGTIRIFSDDNKDPVVLESGTDEAFDIDFSPDGKWIVAGYRGGTVRLWDIDDKRAVAITSHHDDVRAVAFSPTGKTIASGAMDGTLRVTDVVVREPKNLEGHRGPILHVAFAPNGSTLISASHDRTFRIWNVQTGESTVHELMGNAVRRLRLFPDGKTFATTHGNNEVLFWNTHTGATAGSLRGDTPEFVDMAIAPDGKRLVTGVQNGTLWVWDLASQQGRPLGPHDGNGPIVGFGRDGRNIVAVNFDGTIEQWPDDLPTDADALRAWLDAATPETIESIDAK